MNYRTPGVYVEEISKFPPSVAAVATAIPAFIGYTEKAVDEDENDVTTFPYIKRIKSLLDYEFYFGKTKSQVFEIEVKDGAPTGVANTFKPPIFKLYYAMQMYFANGGGPCYIVSVGKQGTSVSDTALGVTALDALKKKDEPTLILFPDAEAVSDVSKYYTIYKNALIQCNNLGDRFTIIDLHNGKENSAMAVDNLRNNMGTNFLKYGAAYTPYLNTNLNYYWHDGTVLFKVDPASSKMNGTKLADIKALVTALELQKTVVAKKAETDGAGSGALAKLAAIATAQAAVSAGEIVQEAAKLTDSSNAAAVQATLDDANAALSDAETAEAPDLKNKAKTAAEKAAIATAAAIAAAVIDEADLPDILTVFSTEFESKLKTLLSRQYVKMPPSSSMAGVYASVDRTRGVWKAPANVSLNNVIAPSAKITDADQETLNIIDNGKSINAIRAFTGKGIMVWGARTLAGNDNEWRYISVRRFFNMVEESVKKATEAFVFEPNDANTWVKVRAMIENFLTLQWRAGALAGAVPEDAFYVKVGLGQTMTAVDILEGRMIVEIGMAAVRPAEFIILRFSHKMQES